ncbi:hypothetical protein [Pseudoalteromonas sp. GB56]
MKGTHGTTRDNARSIAEQGFKYQRGDNESRRGSGAYFWDYDGNCERSKQDAFELAEAFWMSTYSKELSPDEHMSIIDVAFEEGTVVLDATRHEPEQHKLLCELIRISEDKFAKNSGKVDHKELSGVFDNFVAEIEKQWKKTVDAFRVEFKVVDRRFFPARYIVGVESPTCLVVKTTDKILIGGIH